MCLLCGFGTLNNNFILLMFRDTIKANTLLGFEYYDLHEGVCNHLTMMAPAKSGQGQVMLLGPHGLHWKEVSNSLRLSCCNNNNKQTTTNKNNKQHNLSLALWSRLQFSVAETYITN